VVDYTSGGLHPLPHSIDPVAVRDKAGLLVDYTLSGGLQPLSGGYYPFSGGIHPLSGGLHPLLYAIDPAAVRDKAGLLVDYTRSVVDYTL
jgi:hypothetical protein